MRAVEKFHVRDAFAVEHAIGAAGIADFLAGELIAHPIGDTRIRFIMFFTANSETPEPIDYDRALIRAINVSAMLAGVSAIAIPAPFSASIFPAAVPFPPEVIAPA